MNCWCADHYQVVFLGGVSTGLPHGAQNYVKPGGRSAYANTGEWATRAIKESKLFGDTVVVASSETGISATSQGLHHSGGHHCPLHQQQHHFRHAVESSSQVAHPGRAI